MLHRGVLKLGERLVDVEEVDGGHRLTCGAPLAMRYGEKETATGNRGSHVRREVPPAPVAAAPLGPLVSAWHAAGAPFEASPSESRWFVYVPIQSSSGAVYNTVGYESLALTIVIDASASSAEIILRRDVDTST